MGTCFSTPAAPRPKPNNLHAVSEPTNPSRHKHSPKGTPHRKEHRPSEYRSERSKHSPGVALDQHGGGLHGETGNVDDWERRQNEYAERNKQQHLTTMRMLRPKEFRPERNKHQHLTTMRMSAPMAASPRSSRFH